VDGDPAEILRANGLYRAVALERGSRRIVFEYVPDSLRVGGSVSLASVGVLGVLGAIAALRSRSSRGRGRSRNRVG
jgi:hypothetical protein